MDRCPQNRDDEPAPRHRRGSGWGQVGSVGLLCVREAWLSWLANLIEHWMKTCFRT